MSCGATCLAGDVCLGGNASLAGVELVTQSVQELIDQIITLRVPAIWNAQGAGLNFVQFLAPGQKSAARCQPCGSGAAP